MTRSKFLLVHDFTKINLHVNMSLVSYSDFFITDLSQTQLLNAILNYNQVG